MHRHIGIQNIKKINDTLQTSGRYTVTITNPNTNHNPNFFCINNVPFTKKQPPHPFNGLFSRTTWVSRYQKSKTSLDLNETRDDGVLGRSGIRWTICKQSAPRSRQTTTPTPHHSISTGRMLFLTPNQQCQSTEGTTQKKTNIQQMACLV